jgi:3-hydroxy-5-phosphonooxypentane-2,4-dione thiolase
VVEGCPVPVIIAGGKKLAERDALQLTFDAIKDGASGVDMGRNIWQSNNPVAMIKAVKDIVHENSTVEKAYDQYLSMSVVTEQSRKKPRKNTAHI